jgi:poly(hydroxyalkanoate) depolymerase family esterase
MAGLARSIARLANFRHRFEQLLATASPRTGQPTSPSPRLSDVTSFGSNPGNLRMFAYVPERLARRPALVVALHGCTQTAAAYQMGSGWSQLADRYGFVVVYPEQQHENNPKTCFSWFRPGDIRRDHGEALSVRQMVARAVANYGVDPDRVFVTGLSAGGAMTSVMLATYPEIFAGGAIIAGLPYGCAGNVEQGFQAMLETRATPARVLGDRVRAASSHRGPWPKISVWHGSADAVVKPFNADEIVAQWADVHGLNLRPTYEGRLGGHLRRGWQNARGDTVIEAITLRGMAHGVPVARHGERFGEVGPFFLDAGISSSHHIARFWGLAEAEAELPEIAAPLISDARTPVAEGEVLAPVQPARAEPFNPNAIIAAAFAAAGLPVPKTAEGVTPAETVAPEPIIEAALKAAGLKR